MSDLMSIINERINTSWSLIVKIILIIVTIITTIVDVIQFYYLLKGVTLFHLQYLFAFSIVLLTIFIFYFIINTINPRFVLCENEARSRQLIARIEKGPLIKHLKKHGRIHIYEANLQTSNPGENKSKDHWILKEDIELANLATEKDERGNYKYTIFWHMIFLKTPAKEEWIKEWIRKIKLANERMKTNCKVFLIDSAPFLEDYPLWNITIYPDLHITFIGLGKYSGVDGGGLLIRDEETTKETRKTIEDWMKKAQELSTEECEKLVYSK